jgi:hypothetical protein
MEMSLRGTTSEQIGTLPPKLACAGTSEDELLPGLALDCQMDRIQQCRQLLDFVDDNVLLVGVRLEKRDQSFRLTRVLSQDCGVEQIDSQSVLELLLAPRCLAGAAGSQQKKMPPGCPKRSWNERRRHRKMATVIPFWVV